LILSQTTIVGIILYLQKISSHTYNKCDSNNQKTQYGNSWIFYFSPNKTD